MFSEYLIDIQEFLDEDERIARWQHLVFVLDLVAPVGL